MPEFPKKLLKHLPEGWADEACSYSEEELRNIIVKSRNNIDRIGDAMADNKQIQQLEADLGELKGPYEDAKKSQDARVKVCLQILRERGRLDNTPSQKPDEDDEDEDGSVEDAVGSFVAGAKTAGVTTMTVTTGSGKTATVNFDGDGGDESDGF